MQTQRIAELPHAAADKRTWKRQRLGWDVPPPIPSPQVSLSFYCGKEAMNTANSDTQFWQSFYNTGAPRYASPPWRGDDQDGHYIFSIGENLTVRNRILSKMGEGEQLVKTAGTFGQALECLDLENQEPVAIKVVRSLQKYREAEMIEIDVLQRLAKADRSGIRLLRSLDQAYITFCGKITTALSPSI